MPRLFCRKANGCEIKDKTPLGLLNEIICSVEEIDPPEKIYDENSNLENFYFVYIKENEDRKIIGFCQCHYEGDDWWNGKAVKIIVDRICIKKDFQNKGYGTEILQRFKEKKCTIELYVKKKIRREIYTLDLDSKMNQGLEMIGSHV